MLCHQKELSAYNKHTREAYDNDALMELKDREQAKDSRGIWRAVHQLCRTKKTTKARWGRAPKTSNPSMAETYTRMSKPPHKGGMTARDPLYFHGTRDSKEAYEHIITPELTKQFPRMTDSEIATSLSLCDFRLMKRALRKAKNGKSAPG